MSFFQNTRVQIETINNSLEINWVTTTSTMNHDKFSQLFCSLLWRRSKGIMGCSNRVRGKKFLRQFKSWFGCQPKHCAVVWFDLYTIGYLDKSPAKKREPRLLLMGLHFLKAYKSEENNATSFRCDQKTCRQRSCYLLKRDRQTRNSLCKFCFFESFLLDPTQI